MTPPTFKADIICDTWLSSGVFITPAVGDEPADAAVLRPAMLPPAGLLNMDKIDAADACTTQTRRRGVNLNGGSGVQKGEARGGGSSSQRAAK